MASFNSMRAAATRFDSVRSVFALSLPSSCPFTNVSDSVRAHRVGHFGSAIGSALVISSAFRQEFRLTSWLTRMVPLPFHLQNDGGMQEYAYLSFT